MLTAYEQASTARDRALEGTDAADGDAPWRSPSEDVAWAGDELPGRLA
jgi:hypothetical protein